MKPVNKTSEGTKTGMDIHGRIEALDQSVRSVEGRLRAVERRLSGRGTADGDNAVKEKDIYDEIEELVVRVEGIGRSVEELKNMGKNDVIVEIEKKLETFPDVERRMTKLENVNKITIGNVKVPLELSGLVAAFVLIMTGILILVEKRDIIREWYYPFSIGILFGAVVIIKFKIANSKFN